MIKPLRMRLELGGAVVSAVGLGCAGQTPVPPSAPAAAPATDAGTPKDDAGPDEEPIADAEWELEPPLSMDQCTKELDGSREWRVVARALEAADTAEGSSRHVANLLKRAQKQTVKLVARGALSNAEGELFLAELESLREAHTPPDRPPLGGTCYSPPPPLESIATSRVLDRVPLLEQLAAGGTLHPAVLCRIIGPLEQDLAQAESVRASVLRALRTDNPSGPLCDPRLDLPEKRAEWEQRGCESVKRLDRAVRLLKDLRQRLGALSAAAGSGG